MRTLAGIHLVIRRFVCVAAVALGLLPNMAWAQQIPSSDSGENPYEDVAPLLKQYCFDCHGGAQRQGGLSIQELGGDFDSQGAAAIWEELLEKLEDGDMPPGDAPQPTAAQRQSITEWIERGLTQFARKQPAAESGVARRLTNFEYENTMRDLLGVDLDLIHRLPQDPLKPYRFNNSAEFLRLGPEQLERYLEVARFALSAAIVDPEKPEVHRARQQWEPVGNDRGLGLDEVGVWGNRRHSAAWGMAIKQFPRSGEYRIRVKAAAILPPGVRELPLRLVMGYGLNVNSSTLQIHPVGTVRLSNSVDDFRVFEFRGRIENHPVQPGRMQRGRQQPDSLNITPQNLYDDGTLNDERDFSNTRNIAMPRAVVEWIEFEAPVIDSWPPDHHQQILFESPLRETEPEQYLRQVLSRFIGRAFRRPASEAEVDRFAGIFHLVEPNTDSFESALRETLAFVLVSPQFLYHVGTNSTSANEPANAACFDDYTLASRLSYWLWGSMPDEELFRVAATGKLRDPEELRRQAVRLLSDPRAADFVRNFVQQWLSLDKTRTVPINRDLFPRFLYYVPRGERAGTEVPYRPTIRDFMLEESSQFFGELVASNSSVLQLIDSDFAMLNQPLAAHYGISGIQGNHFRRVSLEPGTPLGGLLTHGSVLVGNGTGSAPHPIYRAVWLREAILGDEVAPPPAEVPALTDSVGESAENAVTIKDLLVKHRQVESCNECHARLDPWGIPFEEYNAVGRFQPRIPPSGTRVAGFSSQKHQDLVGYGEYLDSISTHAVDAEAVLPDGTVVNGMLELKQYLLAEKRDAIARNMTRRLVTYAIGRELLPGDRPAINELMETNSKNEFRLRDLIVSICQSELFLQPGRRSVLAAPKEIKDGE